MVVAYDGEPFHGFAANAGVRTVAGTLTDALGLVLGSPVEITCAGRTDRGVHAHGQVVSFDAPTDRLDLGSLTKSLNRMCAPAVAVRDVVVVDDSFDARFSARFRRYRYRIVNRPTPDPFSTRYAWHVDEPLDLVNMALACDPLIGEHDFAAFCRRPKRSDGEPASLVRRVTSAGWTDDGNGELLFEIEASSFCHQMVRSVVGTLVDVGRGRKRAGEVMGIIRSGDRARAGGLAPPHGLSLWSVGYEDWASGLDSSDIAAWT